MNEDDLALFLKEISADKPCGPSLLHDNLFDTIRLARQEDDADLPQGVWATTPKIADWAEVIKICVDVQCNKSKDLQVLGWLGEAWTATEGLLGLTRAVTLLHRSCVAFWPILNPLIEDDDIGYRVTPLEWADDKWAQALEIRAVLIDGMGIAQKPLTLVNLRELLSNGTPAKKADSTAKAAAPTLTRDDLSRILMMLPAGQLQGRVAQVGMLSGKLAELEKTLDGLMGKDAPSFGTLKKALESVTDVLKQCALLSPNSAAAPVAAVAQEDNAALTPVATAGDGAAAPADSNAANSTFQAAWRNREEAYQIIHQISDFLQKTEPHSPVPTLLRGAIAVGNMPFDKLMQEFAKNGGELQKFLSREWE